MGLYGDIEVLLKRKIDLADIYSLFLNFEVGVHTNSPFPQRNTRRGNDSTPSLLIYEWYGQLLFRDFGMSDYLQKGKSDSLGFVQTLKGFEKREEAALYVYNLLESGKKPKKYVYNGYKEKQVKDIKIIPRDTWEDYELNYWKQLGYTKEELEKENIKPLKSYFFNDFLILESTREEPKFIYKFNNGGTQIYNPLAENKKHKFKTFNVSKSIIGYNELPEKSDGLLISKSKKDILVWKKVGAKAVVAPLNEVTLQNIIDKKEEFEERFGKNIYIIFDEDSTGRESEKLLAELTGWKALNLHFEGNSKDAADVVLDLGLEKGLKSIKQSLYNAIKKVK